MQGKAKYPLIKITLVALYASICGADTFIEFVEFGEDKIDFLKRWFPFENAISSRDTFGAVFFNIDRKRFSGLFVKWLQALQSQIPTVAAIDGKTVRRSLNGEISSIYNFGVRIGSKSAYGSRQARSKIGSICRGTYWHEVESHGPRRKKRPREALALLE